MRKKPSLKCLEITKALTTKLKQTSINSHDVFRYELASVATMVLINSKSDMEKFICSFFESDGTDM